MGIRGVSETRAPKGQSVQASFPIGDHLTSSVTHKGAVLGLLGSQIGSFGLEVGLSLGSWLFAPEARQAMTQAMIFEPANKYQTGKDAGINSGLALQKALTTAAQKASFKTSNFDNYTVFADTWMARTVFSMKIVDPQFGCPKTAEYKKSCYAQVWIDDKNWAEEPSKLPKFLIPKEPRDRWVTTQYNFVFQLPDDVSEAHIAPKIFSQLAMNLPKETYLYVAPMRIKGEWSTPYVSDGKEIHNFIVPY